MKLVAAKCPSCGANIEVDKDSDKTKCEYCKTQILVDDAIQKVKVEHSGTIKIDGIEGKKDKYSKARKYIELEEYYSAICLLDEIIEEDDLDTTALTLCYIARMEELKMVSDKGSSLLDVNNKYGIDQINKMISIHDRIKKVGPSKDEEKTLEKYEEDFEKYSALLKNKENNKKTLENIMTLIFKISTKIENKKYFNNFMKDKLDISNFYNYIKTKEREYPYIDADMNLNWVYADYRDGIPAKELEEPHFGIGGGSITYFQKKFKLESSKFHNINELYEILNNITDDEIKSFVSKEEFHTTLFRSYIPSFILAIGILIIFLGSFVGSIPFILIGGGWLFINYY